MGNTEFLLAALIQNFGDYLSQFPKLSLSSFPFEQPKEWMNSWTLFFWAWWIAWSPFVGLFLARISRGRTIREFVTGTLVIPLLFTLTWLSIFGNSALYSVIFDGNTQLATTVLENPAHGFMICWHSIQVSHFRRCRHHYRFAVLCDFSGFRGIGIGELHH